jgi:hypothetical protein
MTLLSLDIAVKNRDTNIVFTIGHLKEGLEVYGLMDAAGDSTSDAHKYVIERMLQAGVIPITLESLVSEWMHD